VRELEELSISILQPVEGALFERGDCVDLIVQVLIGSTPTIDAFVSGNTSEALSFDLMGSAGNYTAKYCFSSTDSSPFTFRFTGVLEIDGIEQSVSDGVEVELKSTNLVIALSTQGPFYVGDLVKPQVNVEYEDETVVVGATVSGQIQGVGVQLQEMGPGIYESVTPYYVSVSDEIAGQLSISLQAIDEQDNTGELGASLTVSPSTISYKIEKLGLDSTLFCFNQPVTFLFKVTDMADKAKDDVGVIGYYHNSFYAGTSVGNGTYKVDFQMPPIAQSEIKFVAFKQGERSEELSFEFELTDHLSMAYPGEFQENSTLWSENQSIEIAVVYPDGTPVTSGTFTAEITEEEANITRSSDLVYTEGIYTVTLNLTNITYGTQVLHFAGEDEFGNTLDVDVEFTFSPGGPIDLFFALIFIMVIACVAIFIGLFSRLYGTTQKRLSRNIKELNKEEKKIAQKEKDVRYSFYKRMIDSITLKKRLLEYKRERAKIEAKKAALKKKYGPKTQQNKRNKT
jgi:hypothetical protein